MPTDTPTAAPPPTDTPAPIQAEAASVERQPPAHPDVPRLALAHYFTWFDGDGWDDCNISAGDKPLTPYHSDDPEAMARHVQMAADVGLDGFAVHWFAPGERTDRNFEALLGQSAGRPFYSTVVIERHIWHGSPAPTQQNVAEAIRYVLDTYGGHPNFLKIRGKPVLFFTNPARVPAAGGQSASAAWAAVRELADPGHQAWWIVEGLDASFLSVFDGLYVFKITHATDPNCYVKAQRWAEGVRKWETQTGSPKLWMATISPGWDDRRSGCRADVRSPSPSHYRDRENGAFYQATFNAAMESNPDVLLITSFNEWVEGTYIEPSSIFGDAYLQITRELISQFKSGG